MEDDKKKKRNKKKKNKQNKTIEEDAVVGVDQNPVANGQNGHDQTPNIPLFQNADVVVDRYQPNGTGDSPLISETQKQLRQQVEASLQETISQLQSKNDSLMQKQSILEDTIKQLQNGNDSLVQKEASLKETIKQLQMENHSHIQKEATLEDAIKQLQNDNYSRIQKEAALEAAIKQFRNVNDLCMQKEAILEEKVKQLESEKDSWILTENSTKETIAMLNIDVTRLRMQVVELEESKSCILKENRQLSEGVSALQLQLQTHEMSISAAATSDEVRKLTSENKELNSQIEAACALVDKLIMENAELVEKVNELYIKLDSQNAAAGVSSDTGNYLMTENAAVANEANHLPKSTEISVLGNGLEHLEAEPAVILYPSKVDSGEIVQIPLDDNEIRDLELQAVESDEKDAVPFSDAPLIGAPYRLISFVAKYVSGADLVNST